MNFIINYWPMLIVAIAIIAMAVVTVIDFINKSPKERIETIKQWAVYACAMAEAHLGSGTGQMKMRETYDMFLQRFPSLATVITYEKYKEIAEKALLEFKQMLSTNPSIQEMIIKEGEIKYGKPNE
jgi:LPS O-antigen subunit length determinant protein (WzzB/FepE family)